MTTSTSSQIQSQTGPTIERLPAILARTGMARSTVYAAIRDGEFPKPIQLSKRSIGFLSSEVNDWIARQAAKRR